MKISSRSSVLAAVLVAALVAPIARAAESPTRLPIVRDRGNFVSGVVEAQGNPLAGFAVTLYAGSPSGSRVLGTGSTDGEGRFSIGYGLAADGTPVYAIARGPGGAALLAVLGARNPRPRSIVVNELTTVAGAYTLARFLDGDDLRGNAVGIRNAAANAANLIDPATGQVSRVIVDGLNIQTTTLATLYSLGNLVGTCAAGDGGICALLFAAATAPGEPAPTDSLAAVHAVALHPWNNISQLFQLATSLQDPRWIPILRYVPTAWTLSLVYAGGGLDAPGGIMFDREGSPWTSNNFTAGSQSFLQQRGFPALGASKLAPDGRPLSGPFGFQGAGIQGSGYGIAIDQRGHVWISNFAGNSLSELLPDGSPAYPTAYTAGGTMSRVQGVAVDQQGNVWAANFGNASVSFFPAGDPLNAQTWTAAQFPKCGFDGPFGLAIDGQGRAWVANLHADTIVRVDRNAPDRCPDGTIPVGDTPMALALDSAGNVWVANDTSKDVTLHRPSTGQTQSFANDPGMVGPWGINVDGDDNVWVADFWGQRLSNLCGVAGKCPPGVALGSPISPPSGYGANGGLQHMTYVGVDQSGNVWAANNNHDQKLCDVPPSQDAPPSVTIEKQSMACGGNGLVVLFGLAPPLGNPLIGLPQRP